ncbi:unnamed protein product [Rhizoctonia solani]|uniref:Peptidase M43 pregnancy-associated plasma-A domain-containing protein n=1 Tax=Rhizoctonia solani TaxID=456999 RepID=A0A8H3CAD6_9AGAM|nr:unnamed protein product [Rhizoctonia solani]
MLFITFTALALGVSSAMADPVTNMATRCASHPSATEIAVAEAHFASHTASAMSPASTQTATSIPVYWHVIQAGTALSEGNIPTSQIAESIRVLNEDYAGTGLTFNNVFTDRTTNATWFNQVEQGNAYQNAMKQALRKGNAAALNIYTVGFRNVTYEGLLGYATFPFRYAGAPMDDGVVIRYSTVPGGSAAPFNLGRTLTHEVGHWVGLYHTFQGGCSGSGDLVNDTPPQGNYTAGCPNGKDTCPGGGLDPIHNYMDYSNDACMNEFTAGQTTRIKAQMSTYRGVSA